MKKMNKKLPAMALALALILLAGCGGNAATATPVPTPETSAVESPAPAPTQTTTPATAPVPTPTPVHTPTPTPGVTPSVLMRIADYPYPGRMERVSDEPLEPVLPGPVELPDVGFEVASMWYASGFGDGGRAFLFLGEPQGETMDVALYMCQYYYEYTYGYPMRHTDTQSQTFSAIPDSDGWRFELDGFSVYVEVNGADLTIYYSNPDGDPNLMSDTSNGPTRVRTFNWGGGEFTAELFYPDRFGYVSPETAPTVWCTMPMFAEEIVRPIPERGALEDLYTEFGEENIVMGEYDLINIDVPGTHAYAYLSDNGHGYIDLSIQTVDPKYAPTLRGLTIGSRYIDVLARFISNPPNESEITRVIYGGSDMPDSRGSIAADWINFFDGVAGAGISCYLDENGLIESIEY